MQYYWVGGTGTWDGTSTTHWATTSGGAGGAGVPAAGDSVTFDANSGTAATVTVAATAVCTACVINKADITISFSGSVTFGGLMSLQAGTLITNNNNMTWGAFEKRTSGVGTLTPGSSQITLTGSQAVVWFDNSTLATTTNTATFILTSSTGTIDFGANNYNGLSFTITGSGAWSVAQAAPTIKNFTYAPASPSSSNSLSFAVNLTCTGTFTVAGSIQFYAPVYSSTLGTPVTITAAATNLSNCIFRDITGAGAAVWKAYNGLTTVVDVHTLESDASQQVRPNQTIPVGKTLIGFVGNSGIYASSVTDSKGNVWSVDATQQGISVISARITTQLLATDTITINYVSSANSNREIVIVMVEGIAATSRLDQVSSNNGFSGVVSVGPTGTLAQANEIAFLAGWQDGGIIAPATGWSNLGATNFDVIYQVESATTGVSGSYTTGTSHWQAVLVTYRINGINVGDAGGNSGITFTPASTQTHSGVTSNWSDPTKWTSRRPLPQDTCLIPSGTGTITVDVINAGGVLTNFTGFTGTLTVGIDGTTWYGSITLGSGMTVTNVGYNTGLYGRGNYTFTSNGKAWPGSASKNLNIWAGAGNTMTFADDFSTGSSINLITGNLTTNGNVSSAMFSTNTSASTVTLGGTNKTWTLTTATGNQGWMNSAGATIIPGSSTILLPPTNWAFYGGSKNYNIVKATTGSGSAGLQGSNTFNILDLENAGTILLAAGATQTVTGQLILKNGVALASTTTGSRTTINLTGTPVVTTYSMTNDVFVPPVFYTAPVVTQSGNVFTCDGGHYFTNPAAAETYQWQESPNGIDTWTAVPYHTAPTYIKHISDENTYIRCVNTVVGTAGTATANSNEISIPVPNRPPLKSFAFDLYDRLTPIAGQDGSLDWALANYCGGIGEMFQVVEDYSRDQLDGNGRNAPGWSQLLDPDRCPSECLPWLGQFVGVVVNTSLSDAAQRDQIRNASGWKRGSVGAIVAAAQAQLTGTKSVTIVERDSTACAAQPAYGLSVYTRVGETPNSAAVLAAIKAQKPGGIILRYVVEPDVTYQDLFSTYATYDAVYSSFKTYQGVYTNTTGT